jgi:3-methylfumaryl-CoA hydratase
MTASSETYAGWLGRSEESFDTITASPLIRFNATLDRDEPDPKPGDPIPPGAHWLYFLPATRQSDLGPNGNPKVGEFLPAVDLPRRMWAGGGLTFHRPLRIDERARKVSTIASITPKEGRSGRLLFVTVRHDHYGETGLALSEDHNIVYREAADPADPNAPKAAPKPHAAPDTAQWRRTLHPDSRLLFRFAALMFNAARIHFDHRYTTETEGYPDLIVNARMVVIALLGLCEQERPDKSLAAFTYRCVSPLFCNAPFSVEGAPMDDNTAAKLWALDDQGHLSLDAEATFS